MNLLIYLTIQNLHMLFQASHIRPFLSKEYALSFPDKCSFSDQNESNEWWQTITRQYLKVIYHKLDKTAKIQDFFN